VKLFDATIKDIFYKQRKREFDANYAFKNRVKSSDSTSVPKTDYQPIESLTTDPVLQQARAEESFYIQQQSSGFEIFQNGQVETAADEQNLRTYEESQQTNSGSGTGPVSDGNVDNPQAFGYPGIYDRPNLIGPGAVPQVGCDPLNAFQAMNMFMGGY